MTEATVPLGRICKNPTCGLPLFGVRALSVKEYCDARCRTIAWALKQAEEAKSG